MKKEMILVFALLLFIPFISAAITTSEPLEVYNLADRIDVKIDGLVGTSSGNFNINLVCGNSTTNLVKIPGSSFSSENSQKYEIPNGGKILDSDDLEILDLSTILGSCQVVASLGGDFASTSIFEITDNVIVTGSLNKTGYDPGEEIIISISAIKANGQKLNGFVDGANATSFSRAIENGVSTESFFVPETAEAGIYYIALNAYDVGLSGVLNKGETVVSFGVNQIPQSLVLSLSDSEAVPGENFSIGVEVFDQSSEKMEGVVSVRVVSPFGEEDILSVTSGEFTSVDFAPNSTVGLWEIVATFDEITETRDFEMTEVQRVDLRFEGPILVVENIGNVIYNNTVRVLIGGESKDLDLVIQVGETRKFTLEAPEGEYEVVAEEGENSITQDFSLTGKIISVDDLKSTSVFSGSLAIWILLLVLIGGFGIILFFKFRKTKTLKSEGRKGLSGKIDSVKSSVASKITSRVPKKIKSDVEGSLNFTNKSPSSQSLDNSHHKPEDETMMDLTKKGVGVAESSLVLKGEKYPSVVISLSIKNHDTISGVAHDELMKLLENSGGGKGLLDIRGEHMFIIFSPLITKTYNNELLASKAGFKILQGLQAHNKKFKDKIEFNLGINSGELIASKDKGKLKYTGVGNTISLAKRISDSGNNQLLVSDSVRKKMLRDLKVSKISSIGDNPVYAVTEMKNREANQAKLKDLLKRMDK